jgi:hypothetical protein
LEPNEPPHVHLDNSGASAKVWLEPVALASNVGFPARDLGIIYGWSASISPYCWTHGMSSSARPEGADIRVRDVAVSEDELTVALMDGRTITVPLAWYPRLAAATPEQRAHWEMAGAGYGIHWPELDEDLSTEGLLAGARAPCGSAAWRSSHSK